jgi:hypothetical protein
VTASQLHIRGEAKIVTDQHTIANADGGGKSLVVRVTHTDHHLAILSVNALASDSKAAEVAKATTTQAVFFFKDSKASGSDSLANFHDQSVVRDGHMGIGCLWGFNAHEGFKVNAIFGHDKHSIFFLLVVGLVSVRRVVWQNLRKGQEIFFASRILARVFFASARERVMPTGETVSPKAK